MGGVGRVGRELSLRAPTLSGSNPDLRDGSGARGVNLVLKARQASLRALSGVSESLTYLGYCHRPPIMTPPLLA
jgi:hypothetical protein